MLNPGELICLSDVEMINTALALPQFRRFKNKIYDNDILGFSYLFHNPVADLEFSGGSPNERGAPTCYMVIFCQNVHANERNWTERWVYVPTPRHGSTTAIKYVDLRKGIIH